MLLWCVCPSHCLAFAYILGSSLTIGSYVCSVFYQVKTLYRFMYNWGKKKGNPLPLRQSFIKTAKGDGSIDKVSLWSTGTWVWSRDPTWNARHRDYDPRGGDRRIPGFFGPVNQASRWVPRSVRLAWERYSAFTSGIHTMCMCMHTPTPPTHVDNVLVLAN